MREYIFLLSAALMLLVSPAIAQDGDAGKNADQKQESTGEVQETQESETTEQAERLKELKAKFGTLETELRKKMMAASKEMADADQETMMETMMGMQNEMLKEAKPLLASALEIADQADADSDTSLDAISWILESPINEFHVQAGEALVKHHLENERVSEIVSVMVMPTQAGQDLYEKIIAQSKSKDIRGKVSMGLIDYLSQAQQMAPMLANNEQIAEMYPKVASYLNSEGVSELTEEVLLEKMKALDEEYGDVELTGSKTISNAIAGKIKAIEVRSRVAVGKVAPEIEGPDIDGEVFKLSDYRGKVVMLDFWGDW